MSIAAALVDEIRLVERAPGIDDYRRLRAAKLAGLERSISVVLADGTEVPGRIDEKHAAGLTRDDVTAAVHYLVFDFTPAQVAAFDGGDVTVQCSLPSYLEVAALSPSTKAELLTDLLP